MRVVGVLMFSLGALITLAAVTGQDPVQHVEQLAALLTHSHAPAVAGEGGDVASEVA